MRWRELRRRPSLIVGLVVFGLATFGLQHIWPDVPVRSWTVPDDCRITGLTPDGRTLLTMTQEGSGITDFFHHDDFCGPVQFWDTETGQLQGQVLTENERIQRWHLAPDGRRLAVVCGAWR